MRPQGTGTLRIDVTDEITAELANAVDHYVAEHTYRSIEVNINTRGGRWDASHVIFDRLVNHPCRVTAQIVKAQSGGALIALAADVRRMDPSGIFFLHWPRGGAQALLDEIAVTKAALIASRARVPTERVLRWMREETRIDAKQALHYGLATEVPGLAKPQHVTVFL